MPSASAYAEAVCRDFFKCNPVIARHFWGVDVALCIQNMTRTTAEALGADGNIVTEAQLDACISKLGISCDQRFSNIPECAFKGTRPNGSSCAYSGQCQGGDCNWGAGGKGAKCGVCADLVAGGAACTGATPTCAPGFACNGTNCVTPAKATDPCSASVRCAPMLT